MEVHSLSWILKKDTQKSEGVEGRVNDDRNDRTSFFLRVAVLNIVKDAPKQGWYRGILPLCHTPLPDLPFLQCHQPQNPAVADEGLREKKSANPFFRVHREPFKQGRNVRAPLQTLVCSWQLCSAVVRLY